MADNSKHILMVDDVTTNLRCAAEVLKDEYRLSMVKSGKQVFQFLEKARPDLILLDINMPDMDGYQIMEKLRKNERYADIPVIFLTADIDGESEEKGLELGAVDYIRKPFEPGVMIRRIEKALQQEESKRKLELSAKKDVLTGLWNRSYLEESIGKYASGGQNTGVFFLIDVDSFKEMNDKFGHLHGDSVLKKVAERIRKTIGEDGIACRIGGDEFAVFFKNMNERDEIAEKALQLVEDRTSDEEAAISVSVGITLMPKDGSDFITLYHNADKALYFVKQNGKHNYHFYCEDYVSPAMDAEDMNSTTKEELESLKKLLEERDSKGGALAVSYNDFRSIYYFISRCIVRTGQSVSLILFTLKNQMTGKSNREFDSYKVKQEEMMACLEQAIKSSLRKGDVATRSSCLQYVIILMDADDENASRIAERIYNKYEKSAGTKQFKLLYSTTNLRR